MFVDRKEEMQVLEREYKKENSFVVLYGRRRTGKTTLIEKFIEEKSALYFLANEEPEIIQRRRFQKLLFEYSKDKLFSNFEQPLDWENLFLAFSRIKGKKILVIDEFQCLGTANPTFPSIFQLAWDKYLSKSNTMVIVCGSLITMMTSQVLNYSSPLYGRRTSQIFLKPISFKSYGDFFELNDRKKLLEFYSITGGIPKYIEEAKNFDTVMNFITEAVLNNDSYLYREPMFLLEKETGAVGTYMTIISQIANGKNKVGEIASAFNMNPSHFTRYLKVLRDLDFVERIVPITEANPEKSKKGLYKIKDRFLNFWFAYVLPNINYLEIRRYESSLKNLDNTFKSVFIPFVYEDLCRDAVYDLAGDGDLPFIPERVGKWWDRNCDIDIVGISKSNILVGECKYTNKQVDEKVLYLLEERAKAISFEKTPYYILFSKNGFSKKLEKLQAQRSDLKLIEFLP